MLRIILLLCCITNCFANTNINFEIYLPPPPKDIYGLACDKTGIICTAVGYKVNDIDDCGYFQCVVPIAYFTSNAGKTWYPSEVARRRRGPDTYQYMLAAACDETGTSCTAVGEGNYSYRYNSEPLTYISQDAGKNWLLSLKQPGILPRPASCEPRFWEDSLVALSCNNNLTYCVSVGYAGCVGNSTADYWQKPLVAISEDGGNTWELIKKQPEPPNATYSLLKKVKCNFTTGHCIARGSFGNNPGGNDYLPIKYQSDDLGKTWTRVENDIGDTQ